MTYLLIILGMFANMGKAQELKTRLSDAPEGLFSGRVAKVNPLASLVRIKIDFTNMRYLNKKDRVDFWNELNPDTRCKSYIAGKSNDYLLLKIPDYNYCNKFIFFSTGAYLKMYSPDLVNNLKMGKELVSILLKKRLAIEGRLTRNKKELEAHIEKVNALNSHYTVLREKLEAQWRDDLNDVEEDRVNTLRNFKDLEIQMGEINQKLEKYRVGDENFEMDRWALDSRLFFKK